jgi:quinohemoprotein ethanol dehydrogenase
MPVTAAEGAREDTNWSLRGGNPEGQHYSALSQINETTISRVGLAWSADIPTVDGPVGTPIVVDGVSYVVGTANMVFAHDLRTGKLLWAFDPQTQYSRDQVQQNWGARVTRGVAYANGKVFVNTGDCRLVAIDAKQGIRKWETDVCSRDGEYTITSAPRVGGGLVFVGPNNTDYGTRRGFVDAYDAATGKRQWRFYTVPGDKSDAGNRPMEMAAKTWDPQTKPMGGSVWEDITYDPVTGLVFIGVGGATPWTPTDRGAKRGDELFTNSIVALKAKTGEYVWHYQTTPNDAWNLEPTMPMVLADLKVDGKPRRVLMEAPKNGFFYVLDPATGKLVNQPRNFVPVNWAKEIDFKTGRPVTIPDAEYWNNTDGAVVKPSPLGAHGWVPMSFSPATGLVYVPALDLAAKMTIDRSATSFGGQLNTDMLYGMREATFPLIAWDPVSQQQRWTTAGTLRGASGVLSTGGNLVFQGAADGRIRAYRATDGSELWSYDTGGHIIAAPVTVEIDGQQLLLIVSGSAGTSAAVRAYPQLYTEPGVNGPPRLFAFRIGGTAAAPKRIAPIPFSRPPLPRPDAALAQRGRVLFETKGCDLCHGARAQAVPGSVPDLRRASAETHAQLKAIVKEGARAAGGMPAFGDSISDDELEGIQAQILNAAWDAYEAQQSNAAR